MRIYFPLFIPIVWFCLHLINTFVCLSSNFWLEAVSVIFRRVFLKKRKRKTENKKKSQDWVVKNPGTTIKLTIGCTVVAYHEFAWRFCCFPQMYLCGNTRVFLSIFSFFRFFFKGTAEWPFSVFWFSFFLHKKIDSILKSYIQTTNIKHTYVGVWGHIYTYIYIYIQIHTCCSQLIVFFPLQHKN